MPLMIDVSWMDRAALRAALAAIDPDLVTLIDQLEALEARVAALELRAGIAPPADAATASRVVH
jgi:hypothetical protein